MRWAVAISLGLCGACGGDDAAPTSQSSPDGAVHDAGARVDADSTVGPCQGLCDASNGSAPEPDAEVLREDSAMTDAPLATAEEDASLASGAPGCTALVLSPMGMVEQSSADSFSFSDETCHSRTAAMFRNDAIDAFGEHGGYMRSLSYLAGGQVREARGTGAQTGGDLVVQGCGYIVDHFSGATSNVGVRGATDTVLAGRHHAIEQYTWTLAPGGPVKVTAQWMFATGRSNPLFTVTFDTSQDADGAVQADTRAPYCDLAWDGVDGDVSGDGWGDAYKFTTTGPGPVTAASPWDYTRPNVIPYAYEWSTAADAEMGFVTTVPFTVKEAGGDYGGGLLTHHWGQTGTSLLSPDDEGGIIDVEWPFQLNQYEIRNSTHSHRLAWGSNYGAVGMSKDQGLGEAFSGWPYYSYSLFIVLGAHSASAVEAQVAEMENVQGFKLTATEGTVALDGPAGIARPDRVAFVPAGWDPVYAAFAVDSGASGVTVSVDPAGKAISNPVFEIRGFSGATAPRVVSYGDRSLTSDVDYFATVDTQSRTLWLTLHGELAGAGTLSIH